MLSLKAMLRLFGVMVLKGFVTTKSFVNSLLQGCNCLGFSAKPIWKVKAPLNVPPAFLFLGWPTIGKMPIGRGRHA